MVKDLDFCDENSFPLLFQFKLENDRAEKVLMHEVASEYTGAKVNPKVYQEAEKMNRQVAYKRRRMHKLANAGK
jgi:hypothetical protein